MDNSVQNSSQITPRNNFKALMTNVQSMEDTLTNWLKIYFEFEVTTSPTSQKVQKRDLKIFIDYMIDEESCDLRIRWTPRLSRKFFEFLKSCVSDDSKRRWNDNSIKRIISHLKPFANWVHKYKPFDFGNPMEKIKAPQSKLLLHVERAISDKERDRILDAADILVTHGAVSKDRKRFRNKERPQRKSFRGFRNRAIVYLLTESGMRRTGVVNVCLDNIDFSKNRITTIEKGGNQKTYDVSQEGMNAIKTYIDRERTTDNEKWQSPFLFLATCSSPKGSGKLNVKVVNTIWNDVCEKAMVFGKTPHSARHGMGVHVYKKTGNIAAVQDQLQHANAIYSVNYTRISREEKQKTLNER